MEQNTIFQNYIDLLTAHYVYLDNVLSKNRQAAGELSKQIQGIARNLYGQEISPDNPEYIPIMYYVMGFNACGNIFFNEQEQE